VRLFLQKADSQRRPGTLGGGRAREGGGETGGETTMGEGGEKKVKAGCATAANKSTKNEIQFLIPKGWNMSVGKGGQEKRVSCGKYPKADLSRG